jgi:hypothetical protein
MLLQHVEIIHSAEGQIGGFSLLQLIIALQGYDKGLT